MLILLIACSNESPTTQEFSRPTPYIEATVEARVPEKVVTA
ncbi:uncharacterized protein METZ01_LOCUS504208, partial [marine metagenome]